jgi:hypothetical protein
MSELEAAGLEGHLANPQEAKQRMRGRNKTDALDAKGLANLLYERRLPEVWIPSAKLLDPAWLDAVVAPCCGRSVCTSTYRRYLST